MSESEYYLLGNSDTPWCCPDCWSEALPYHNVSGLSDISISTPSQPVHQPVFHSNPSHSSPSASSLNSLSIYYANCRSILPKLDALRVEVSSTNPSVIALTETWLDTSIPNSELCIPGYSIVRRDRDRRGGGILLFVNDQLSITSVTVHPVSYTHLTLPTIYSV